MQPVLWSMGCTGSCLHRFFMGDDAGHRECGKTCFCRLRFLGRCFGSRLRIMCLILHLKPNQNKFTRRTSLLCGPYRTMTTTMMKEPHNWGHELGGTENEKHKSPICTNLCWFCGVRPPQCEQNACLGWRKPHFYQQAHFWNTLQDLLLSSSVFQQWVCW